MSTIIGSISLALSARTNKFTSSMKMAQANVAAFGDSVRATAVRLAGLAGVTIGVGAFAAFVKQSLQAVDASARLADRLGITTEELVGFEHAGRLAGQSAESVTKGLEKLVRNLGDAASGSGVAVKSLDKLGLSAKQLLRVGTAEAFRQIADRIALLPTAAERASAAVALLGKSGIQTVNVLLEGRKGLEGAAKDARELGLAFSRLDAEKVNLAMDKFDQLRTVLRGIGNVLAVEIAPLIIEVNRRFVDWVKSMGGAGKLGASAFEGIALGIGKVMDAVELVTGAWHGFVGVVSGTITGLLMPIDFLAKKVNGLKKTLGLPVSQLDSDFSQFVEDMGASAEEQLAKAERAFSNVANDVRSEGIKEFFAELRTKADQLAVASLKAGDAVKTISPSIDRAGLKSLEQFANSLTRETRNPFEAFTENFDKMVQAFEAGFLDIDGFIRGSAHLMAEFEKNQPESKVANLVELVQPPVGRQIDLANTVIPGVHQLQKQTQKVNDPQLQTTNKRLFDIYQRMAQTSGAVTS